MKDSDPRIQEFAILRWALCMSQDQAQSQKDLEPGHSGRKLHAALALVFSGLLILMFGAGIGALWQLRRLHAMEHEVSNRFQNHTRALSAIVISINIYNDQLARMLSGDDPAVQPELATEIGTRAAQAHSALRNYPSDSIPREREFLGELETKLTEEEQSSYPLFSLNPAERRGRSRQFLHEQLLPRSLAMLQYSEQISTINTEQMTQGNEEILARFAALQAKLKSMLLVTLAAGLVLSLVGGFYILRLEQQTRARYQALAESRLELEQLSARLVEIQEEERRSIARELHDEVGQTLEALLVGLGNLLRHIPANEKTTREEISHVKSLAESSVKNVRDIALLLRPSMLDDLGLIPALEWQAREVSRRGEMEVDVHAEMVSEQLPDDLKICVYRLVQEALNNAAAHASAKHARVSVARTVEKVRVEITDDGTGFDAQRIRGMGLLGMEERVKRLGGSLRIESRLGQGTTVIAKLPLPLVSSG